MLEHTIREEFERLISRPDDDIQLAKAALTIARMEYPELDINRYVHRIDEMADAIRHRLPSDANAAQVLKQLNQMMFIEQGYEGNSDHYYDPRNSFLNDVLDRKLGIPISLSILYMELGHKLGIPLTGVSFPGHFLVKLDIDDGAIVLDPYFGGITLSEDDIEERLQEYYGERIERRHYHGVLATSTNKSILMRMLRNLRNIYMQDQLWEKALHIADIMVKHDDDREDALMARAVIFDKLECFQSALKDYKRYLVLDADEKQQKAIRQRVIELAEVCRHVC